jgi:hypothetical protein
MTEQTDEERIKKLVRLVDDNVKHRKAIDVFQVLLPAILILVMLLVIVFLMIYQWTELSLLSWTPGVFSIIAIIISFNSYAKSSAQSVNKRIIMSLARRLKEQLDDKSDRTFYLLVPLVALKQSNYPLRLSVLYEINKDVLKPEKLMEYYFKD